MSPKHAAVLDAVSAVTSGMHLGSIKGRLPKISGETLEDILRDLVRTGQISRNDRPPHLYKRVWTQGAKP